MSMPNRITNVPSGGVWKAGHPDKISSFLLPNLKSKIEIWPLAAFLAIVTAMASYTMYWSLTKPEVHINRSRKHKPTDWERARNEVIGKKWHWLSPTPTVDQTHTKRSPDLDEIQEEIAKVKNI